MSPGFSPKITWDCISPAEKMCIRDRLQDELTGALIGLARATDGETSPDKDTWRVMVEGLFTTVTNVNFNEDTIRALIDRVHSDKEKLVAQCSVCSSPCGRNEMCIRDRS